MSAFLDTVNVVSIAIILSVIIEIGKVSVLDWRTTTIAIVSLIITSYFKQLNTAFIIFGGALLGYLLTFVPV